MDLKDQIDRTKLPKHIAIIMDGNGRWAREKGKPRIFGHRNAIKAVTEAVEGAAEIGIRNLTLYAFSTENWNRPRAEVNALMELLVSSIHKEINKLDKNNIRLLTIGNTGSLPKKCFKELMKAIEQTAGNTQMNLIIALSYSSKWEILKAVKEIATDTARNKIGIDEIDEALFSSYLTTKNLPDPELLIRTSGEHRISNFLLWQLAYAELYFFEKYWPDFRREDLQAAVIDYQKRERRFGLTGEQISIRVDG